MVALELMLWVREMSSRAQKDVVGETSNWAQMVEAGAKQLHLN